MRVSQNIGSIGKVCFIPLDNQGDIDETFWF